MSKVSKVTVNYIELRKISSKHLQTCTYLQNQHLGRNTPKMICF